MALTVLPWHSVKIRITLATLATVLLSLWSLAFYACQMLRDDMQRLLSEQQFATASFMASQVNQELDDRFKLLGKVAKIVGPAILGNAASLQAMLENRPALQEFFNGGYIAYGLDGTALAVVPFSAGRIGGNDLDIDTVAAALKEGRATIGRPVMDKKLLRPVFGMTVPIRDATGQVIGALGGVTDLSKLNFMEQITENRYGKRGDYYLVAPQYRLILAGTGTNRFMETLPAPGINPVLDRLTQGNEGSSVIVSPQGLEVLTSVKSVPVAGWYVGAMLPTAESFASVRVTQQRMLLATFFMTLLAGIVIWWMLRHQLSPLLSTAKTLAILSDKNQPLLPLPIQRQDEIGQLIGGFNHLLEILARREVALRESESHLRGIIENEPECIKIVDEQGRLVEMNRAGLAMIEADSLEQVAGRAVLDLIAPEWRPAFAEMHREVIAGASRQLEFDVIGLKGGRRRMETHAVPMQVKGRVMQLAITRDISGRKQAEEELRIAATTFESHEGMTITNANLKILRVNRAFTEITGYSAEDAVGQTPSLLSSGRHDAGFYTEMWRTIACTGSWQGEIWNRRKNGEVYPEWLSITAVKDEAGLVTHYVASFSDITSRKTAEGKINNLAFYDPLTRLPNRRLLMDRLEQALAAGSRHQRKGALLFIDLDNFKTINDTLGHDKGDLLLQQVAKRLSTCIREGDTVARLGGDEFVVMMEDLSENALDAATQAETVGEKIRVTLNETYQLASYTHHSTPSIGITLFGDQQETIDEPMKRADLAMYQAKAAGRNTLRFFDPQMQAVVTARAALEMGLREAVLKNQFCLFYQAQVTGNSQVTGAEALVRWLHPQRGLVSPAEFIPLAEETGLILQLGQWVLDAACTQLAQWATQPAMAHLTVAVNVSARQFLQPDFVEQVLAVLERTGVNPQRLKLELTESLLVSNVEDTIAKMGALKERGVGFSLDDFGTGYSSLSYLKRLPLDQLKIDQGFVRDILIDSNDAAIAKMVVALANSLGLAVIAEGVETEAQRDFLAGQGCHAYQGYLFSRPLPLEEFEAFVKRV